MKTIKIAHLYYDLMNLYGENGNIRYLVKKLENQGLKVQLDKLSCEDDIHFNYDFYYMGMGSEENRNIVIENILQYKDDINKEIEKNKYFLITGNSLEIFGDALVYGEDKVNGLDIFKFNGIKNNERIVGDQRYFADFLDRDVIGFENRDYYLSGIKNYMFKVINGDGSTKENVSEGIHYNNFYGTYLLGPILVRNPHFTEYLVEKLVNSKGVEYKEDHDEIAIKAYEEYLRNFYDN